jgi:uncharacterized protein YfaS (alpha-2-macroglobulin family)
VPVVLSGGLTSYLVNFQHYCSEQIVSSAMPRLVLAKWPQVPVFAEALQPTFGDKKLSNDEALAQFLDVLHARQNGQGGFGLWAATPDADPFVSTYAMHFMLEARDRGISVPRDMFDAGNKYLHQLASDESLDGLDLLRQRAYAVYLLTRQGNVTTNDLAAVQKRLQDAYPNQWKDDLAAAWLAASYQLLKQDKQAAQLIAGPQKLLERTAADKDYSYGYYYDSLTRDASTLYLLGKHFPERAKALSPRVMENISAPLSRGWYNTLSSSMTLLALDAYAAQTGAELDKLRIDEVHADGSIKAIATLQGNLLLAGSWDAAVNRLRFTNASSLPAWRVTSQGGFDIDAPGKVIKDGLEIIRDYTDVNGKAIDQITLGQEVDVHLKIRATGTQGVGNVAIVDLLPGGFEPVIQPAPVVTDQQDNGNPQADEGGDSTVKASAWRSPIGVGKSTWTLEYADVREDRVVLYGTALPDVGEFVYRIKATNAGKFIVPPAYGESLYDRRIQARTAGGVVLTVARQP